LYNAPAGLALVCPITSRAKGYPFEVALPSGLTINGVVLADHAKSLDWQARRAVFVETAPSAVVDEVIQKLETLLH
jgi:mRNA interferase MazF